MEERHRSAVDDVEEEMTEDEDSDDRTVDELASVPLLEEDDCGDQRDESEQAVEETRPSEELVQVSEHPEAAVQEADG